MSNQLFMKLQCVAVPVTDQDRAKALFEGVGFTTTLDAELQPGFRWLELSPPGGGTSIAVVLAGDHLPAGIDTGIRLITPDARAAHADLAAGGWPWATCSSGRRRHRCSASRTPTGTAST